jgi:hypothetical protein
MKLGVWKNISAVVGIPFTILTAAVISWGSCTAIEKEQFDAALQNDVQNAFLAGLCLGLSICLIIGNLVVFFLSTRFRLITILITPVLIFVQFVFWFVAVLFSECGPDPSPLVVEVAIFAILFVIQVGFFAFKRYTKPKLG